MIRDIDKIASKIPAPAAQVLLTLALHGGGDRGIFPSESLLSRETGMTDRNVRRMLDALVKLDLISVQRGRQHTPNTYTLRPDVLSALPTVQTGRIVRPGGSQTRQLVTPDRTSGQPRPDKSDTPDRTYCPPKIHLKNQGKIQEKISPPARPLQDNKAEPTGSARPAEGFQPSFESETETESRRREKLLPPQRLPLRPTAPKIQEPTSQEQFERNKQESLAAIERLKADPSYAPRAKGAAS